MNTVHSFTSKHMKQYKMHSDYHMVKFTPLKPLFVYKTIDSINQTKKTTVLHLLLPKSVIMSTTESKMGVVISSSLE